MKLPDHVSSRWIATLDDSQLVVAEAALHATFRTQEIAEKARSGARYVLLQGPPTLVNSWLRWVLVSNEARTRGLTLHHRAR